MHLPPMEENQPAEISFLSWLTQPGFLGAWFSSDWEWTLTAGDISAVVLRMSFCTNIIVPLPSIMIYSTNDQSGYVLCLLIKCALFPFRITPELPSPPSITTPELPSLPLLLNLCFPVSPPCWPPLLLGRIHKWLWVSGRVSLVSHFLWS